MGLSPENTKFQIKIDDVSYSIAITDIKRTANILDKSAYRSEDGDLHREVIGTYYNYEISFGMLCRTVEDRTEYNKLFEVLSEPVEYHNVEFPHDHISYKAYFSNVKDELLYLVDDDTYAAFRGLTCSCISKLPRKVAK